MIVTIVGAGTVGSHLAKYLSGEHIDIYIIDKDLSKLELLDAEYNLMAISGDAIEPAVLKQAEVSYTSTKKRKFSIFRRFCP